MNIKGLIGANQINNGPSAADGVQKKERVIKSENTEERDGNGQELYSKQQKKKKMSKEQFQTALEILNKKTFMTDMKWTAYEVQEGNFLFAEVRSESGEVIRRMSEFDLWEVFEDHSVDENKGQLLKKTA